MTSTTCNEDEELFRSEISRFAKEVIKPHVMSMDEKEELHPDVLKGLFELGLMGIDVPEEFGGAGGNFFMACLAIIELAKVDPSISVIADVQNTLVNNIFKNWGSQEQKEKYLPELCSSKVGCFCLTEADSGSDAFSMTSRAVKDGTDYIISGKKVFITNAKEAEIFVVFANVDPSVGYKGITAFVVEKGQEGLSLGKKEEKLGIRASSTCEVILEKVRVSESNVMGPVGQGYKIAIETLNEGRIGIASQMLGLAQGALDGAWAYAKQRSQFGKNLTQFQGIQFQLASMASDILAAQLLVYHAARLKDAGKPFQLEAAVAKHKVSEIAEQVASLSLEIYGGYGFIKEFPAEKFYRDVKIGKLYEGTTNLQLQTIFKYLDRQLDG